MEGFEESLSALASQIDFKTKQIKLNETQNEINKGLVGIIKDHTKALTILNSIAGMQNETIKLLLDMLKKKNKEKKSYGFFKRNN